MLRLASELSSFLLFGHAYILGYRGSGRKDGADRADFWLSDSSCRNVLQGKRRAIKPLDPVI